MMMKRMPPLRLFTFAMLIPAAALAGCSPGQTGPQRFDVSGNVTYKNQPLPRGTIQFQPDSAKGNSGPAANAEIVDGKYDTTMQGTGTVGGPHLVVIQGFDGNARPDDELPLGMPLFSDYQTSADLPKSAGETVDFEVP